MTTTGQRLALSQLEDIAEVSAGAFELSATSGPNEHGSITATISIDCRNLPRATTGLRVRARESFTITIDTRFPLTPPSVEVPHRRWAGYPHVQWGCHLCLYAAPKIEWQPADAIHGFLDRLLTWLERAALGTLDPDGQPLHPPVAYGLLPNTHEIYIPVDVGNIAPSTTFDTRLEGAASPPEAVLAVAICVEGPGRRIDVQEWVAVDEFERRFHDNRLTDDGGRQLFGALAVLTDREDHFEYPYTAKPLLASLAARGVDRVSFFVNLARIASLNELLDLRTERHGDRRPLITVVGTPSRAARPRRPAPRAPCTTFRGRQRVRARRRPSTGSRSAAASRCRGARSTGRRCSWCR